MSDNFTYVGKAKGPIELAPVEPPNELAELRARVKWLELENVRLSGAEELIETIGRLETENEKLRKGQRTLRRALNRIEEAIAEFNYEAFDV